MQAVFSGNLTVSTTKEQRQENRPMRDNKRYRYHSENGVIFQFKGAVTVA